MAMNVCDQCLAQQAFTRHRDDLLYTDVGWGAGWRETVESDADYMARTPVAQRSPWASIPGWRKSRCFWDDLHVLLLGVFRDACGSIVWSAWLGGLLGEGPANAALGRLFGEFKRWCVRRGRTVTRKNRFTKSSLHAKDGYAGLVSFIKAATVKDMAQWLAQKVRDWPVNDANSRYKFTVAWAMGEYLTCCDDAGPVFSREVSARVVFAGRAFIQSYACLARSAVQRNQKEWKMRPKLHYFEHILDT
eukprot:3661108-Alexandrium_andersonii.AAC.1